METKEKLLTLAIACLNNKEFYALSSLSGHYALPSNQVNNQRIVCSPDKTRHRLSLIDIRRTHINEVKCKYSDITDFDQTIYDKIKKEYEDENNKFSEEVYYYLNILFNDNPPININFYSNINSSQIIDKFEVPIRKYISGNIFIKAKTINDGFVSFEVNKSTFDFYPKITFGTISAIISFEEMNELCEIFIKNIEKFQKEIDNDKLNERFKHFVQEPKVDL
ncbi:MAG: hypothetical protein US96_C0029G0006 [Candidatus Woesebacteria bacterium GW2011_GWB1_38_5b]|uniref:Uncharacterized protein n=1 Tax=Candidatus Woesebacteria bacterium GW2011_GWB1_38_5b TaxID=1618569 RepID=A0A0G0K708_9BACT|nr:MAG: hypothetical protein US96_C0029G0006 [Candidatus Woesebacteria bacterium GW2011_GWB1_38_5b]